MTWQVRQPSGPVLELRGHCRKPNSKGRIYKPSFSHGGRAVSAVGHASNRLCVFSAADGSRLSEGTLVDADESGGAPREPIDGGCTLQTVGDGEAEALVLAHGRYMEVLVPWAPPAPTGE